MRALIGPSIQHRWIVAVAAAITLAYGLISLTQAPLDVFPEFVPPQISVQTEAPGWSPLQVEERVTTPIEQALAGAAGVISMRSESIAGLSVINLDFADGIDLYAARQGIGERLGEVATRLPTDIAVPKMSPLTSSTMDLLKIGLQSERADARALRQLAEWTLKPRLLAVPGVARVTLFGGDVPQWQIQFDPDKLEANGLALATVIAEVRAAIASRGGGVVELDAQRVPIVFPADQATADSLAAAVIGDASGVPILLGDVARVVAATATPIGDTLIQGGPGVLLTISGQYGSNTLSVTRAVERMLAGLEPQLAAQGVRLVAPLHRPASFIERALGGLGQALAFGSLLILVVLYLFLRDWRSVAISFLTIPLSLLAAIMVLEWRGETLNTLTLGGFAVALGVLVDDAIIDIENILRRLGENAKHALPRPLLTVMLDASLEIRAPVLYATIVVVLVFLPVFALSGVQGRLLAPMASAFVLSVLASLLVALTVTPALCALLLQKGEHEHRPSWWLSVARWHQVGMLWVDRHFRIAIIVLLLALTAAIAVVPHLQTEFFPMFREGHFVLQVSARQPGTSITEMLRVGRSISAEVLKLPYVASIEQQIGRAELGEDTWGSDRSEFHVELRADADIDQVAAQHALRRILRHYPALQSEVMTFLGDRISETMTGETAQVVVSVVGDDLDAIDRIAAQVMTVADRITGVIELHATDAVLAAQLAVRVNAQALAFHGVRSADVSDAVASAFAGVGVGQVFENGHAVDVVFVLPATLRQRPEQIGALALIAADGRRLALRDVATVVASQGRSSIRHDAARRRAVVTFNVSGRTVPAAVNELRAMLARDIRLPSGTFIEIGGVAEAELAAHRELALYAALALVLVGACLGLAFGRADYVLMVLLNLPFALVGSIGAIAISGVGLTIGALVGLITVFGISARNAILLLAHYQHLLKVEGQLWNSDLALRGAGERLRPVLMTALVTGLGLIPLALGAGKPGHEIEAPMAIAVLGGLVTSTLLTLFVLPPIARRFAAVKT